MPPPAVGVDVDDDNPVVAMTLEVGRSRHHQPVHRAESVTLLRFGVVQTRRERASHTVTHRCLGRRDDTGRAVDRHLPDAGIPAKAVGLGQRRVGTGTDGIDILGRVHAFDVEFSSCQMRGTGGDQLDTGDPARLQRVGNVTGFAGGVEAVLGTDVLIVESGQQHVEPKSRVESVGGTGSFNTNHLGVGEPLIEGVSEVLDPVRYGGRASSGPPAD